MASAKKSFSRTRMLFPVSATRLLSGLIKEAELPQRVLPSHPINSKGKDIIIDFVDFPACVRIREVVR